MSALTYICMSRPKFPHFILHEQRQKVKLCFYILLLFEKFA